MPRLKGNQPQWAELRPLVIRLLGSRCKNTDCKWWDDNTQTFGCRDTAILQVDHVLGDGAEDRVRYNNVYRHIYGLINVHGLEYVLRYYQLLCPNCNWLKRFRNKEERSKEGHVPTVNELNERGKNIPGFIPLQQSRSLEEIKNTPGLLGATYQAAVKIGIIKEDK